MAIAAEELSPEAAGAVSAAAAGHGTHLTPEVADELRRVAMKKARRATAVKIAKGTPHASAKVVRSAASTGQGIVHVYQSIPTGSAQTGGGKMLIRLVFAAVAFLVALELASYVSGRYFNYSLGKGAQNIAGAAKYVGLYPGQKAPGAA